MQFELDVDDIDLSKADRLVANLFGMEDFHIERGMVQIDHLIKKYGIEVQITDNSLAFLQWSASDPDYEFPTQYGSRAIEAAIRMLLVRVFTNSSAVISFDLVFNSVTDLAALEIVTKGSPFHLVTKTGNYYTVSPEGKSYDDVEAFQMIVRRTRELSDLRFITLEPNNESRNVGDGMIGSVRFQLS